MTASGIKEESGRGGMRALGLQLDPCVVNSRKMQHVKESNAWGEVAGV